MSRALFASLALALAFVPAAAGHGGGGDKGYRSTVKVVRPAVPGLQLAILDGDDRIKATNESTKAVVIEGYGGEPYIRLSPDGVFENKNSPALYLNKDRFARTEVPANAKAGATPDWVKVADGNAYEWHDHRAHWMSPLAPKPIRDAPDSTHHVFNWEVPGKAGGRSFVIAGSLDYSPPQERRRALALRDRHRRPARADPRRDFRLASPPTGLSSTLPSERRMSSTSTSILSPRRYGRPLRRPISAVPSSLTSK